jgi:PcaR/PcaU/PobR family beta-ketoadipate pathway transcriptional regulator
VSPSRPSRAARPEAGDAVQTPIGDPDFMLSLARGLAAIRAFGGGASQLSVADVARIAGLSRASARRCLHTLSVLGYATAAGGRYELTPSILTLGQAYLSSTSVARVAQPVLERVSDELHESSSVAVLDGDEIVYVARAAARRILAISLEVGSRLPAACTSMGRVLLAAQDPDERARVLRRVKLPRYTARTITDKAARSGTGAGAPCVRRPDRRRRRSRRRRAQRWRPRDAGRHRTAQTRVHPADAPGGARDRRWPWRTRRRVRDRTDGIDAGHGTRRLSL